VIKTCSGAHAMTHCVHCAPPESCRPGTMRTAEGTQRITAGNGIAQIYYMKFRGGGRGSSLDQSELNLNVLYYKRASDEEKGFFWIA